MSHRSISSASSKLRAMRKTRSINADSIARFGSLRQFAIV
jgi:hypothetical protein